MKMCVSWIELGLYMFVFVCCRLQEARLALLMRFLQERELQQDKITVQQLDEHYSQRQREKEARIQKIRNNYVLCKNPHTFISIRVKATFIIW